jgi:hypothetical protein
MRYKKKRKPLFVKDDVLQSKQLTRTEIISILITLVNLIINYFKK